ncbi:MAG: hypothetical protein ABI970_20445 [Chloroflexota bacterium]|nr:hypothetical protein [Anaerolineae bacterium]
MPVQATPQTPKLLMEASISRRPFFRRTWLSIIGLIVTLVGIWLLDQAENLGKLPYGLWLPLTLAVGLLGLIFLIRAILYFVRWLRTKNETLKLYNQGIVLTRGKDTVKYGWASLHTYREGSRALRLTMQNGKVVNIDRRYGDLAPWAGYIRQYAARVTGVYIARAIREERPVVLHPKLTIWPGGVEVDKKEIPWSNVDVRLMGKQLVVFQRAKSGNFQKVKAYNVHTVDNVGGFLEVAHSTMKNHQRERFGV